MGFWEFLFGIVVITVLVGVGIWGVAIWGITRGVKAIGRRLNGRFGRSEPKLSGSQAPTNGPSAPAGAQNAAPRQQTQPHASSPRDYEYLDADKGTTPAHIIEVIAPYESQRIVGFYAHEVRSALEKAEFRHRQLFAEIDVAFERESLSWARFAEPATEAVDAIVRNAALLANRVQAFDVAEYEEMERFYRNGGYSANAAEDAARIQRWRIIDDTKHEMDRLRNANAALMLELDKLLNELRKLSSSESSDSSARIAEEVSRLVEETKYYR